MPQPASASDIQPTVLSINVGTSAPNPFKTDVATGHAKVPVEGPVLVSPPGELGSGIAGDFIGDGRHHGGDDQAVYAFERDVLDYWQGVLDRELPNGSFGENLNTVGVDLNDSRVGDCWTFASGLQLIVTSPRVPCGTFAGRMQVEGWLKKFWADGRSGAYLSVKTPGSITAGDPFTVESGDGRQLGEWFAELGGRKKS